MLTLFNSLRFRNRFPALTCFFLLAFAGAQAAEPFFKQGDVIALVGGEDMVVASEGGYLELLLTRTLPDLHLRFRNLAWEGDTVFEQRRDLNFPSWEEQLDKIGATVVIVQFGQMESLAGKEKLPEFIVAYQALLARFSAEGKRRVVVLGPNLFEQKTYLSKTQTSKRNASLAVYSAAILKLKTQTATPPIVIETDWASLPEGRQQTRDGLHLSDAGHRMEEGSIGHNLDSRTRDFDRLLGTGLDRAENVELHRLLALIVAKNRLWFDYWRPQNWAFLAGDRTSQPSSRDYLDPSKRWFPPEREQFLPLIEAQEKEIDALAQKLAKP
jgi:hypothetical protein